MLAWGAFDTPDASLDTPDESLGKSPLADAGGDGSGQAAGSKYRRRLGFGPGRRQRILSVSDARGQTPQVRDVWRLLSVLWRLPRGLVAQLVRAHA
jgi:hypothetical protein